jgi:hypothetical protein
MDTNKVAITIYVVVSLITIGVLLYFLIRCENKYCDGYCNCSHGSGQAKRICQSDQSKQYANGATEYQDFAKMQQMNGGPQWPAVQPGDMNYPLYVGCPPKCPAGNNCK